MTSRPLRILCHGDSLTSGYAPAAGTSRPYGAQLEQRLRAAFPGTDVAVEVDGVPGELATSTNFIGRLRNNLGLDKYAPSPNDNRFDWVIVLGGTNDLGWGKQVPGIYSALAECWDAALGTGSQVLALTVPESARRSATADARRDDLNTRVLGHEAEGYHTLDLHAALPNRSLLRDDRRRLWDWDGLHLSPEGYDWMGDIVADGLIARIKDQADTS